MPPRHAWPEIALEGGIIISTCVILLLEVAMEEEYRGALLVLLCLALTPA